ncbi:hypothetical protein [Hymenobacter sp. CRA2]|uniref:hypothetical protein n=1 Tax=Hymenobacter sp. CRA2 TaxID=1955620 RepID=UPI00098F7ED5|nr:hypothetical protein [Hymenobacter sp. CRA2]OON68010.1 hypothetical protein B0919_15215 [Hymenobacter sp. CRA2]
MCLATLELEENELVISVPGNQGGEDSLQNHRVYEFPASDTYKYRMVRYIVARNRNGSMRYLCRISKFLIFDPSVPAEIKHFVTDNPHLSEEEKKRLAEFLQAQKLTAERTKKMRYFVCNSTYQNLGKRHPNGGGNVFPRLAGQAVDDAFRCYFTRAELTSGRMQVLKLEREDYERLSYYPGC